MDLSLDSLEVREPATPPPAALAMPAQNLRTAPVARFNRQPWSTLFARVLTFGGALALTAYAGYQMYLIISTIAATRLQWLLLVLFVLTFGWIALAASSAMAGVFWAAGRRMPTPDAELKGRTVLLMPVYNENPAATCSALCAMANALIARQQQKNVEIFIISDSTDPELWLQETAAVDHLRRRLHGRMHVWYRRRYHNRARKAGNVEEFVQRWGARYDYMIVLDADSLMAADTLCFMVRAMDADPQLGILQTLPRLYAGKTLFARLQQFAGALYGPVVARGISAWQGDDGNYWGHNAIIRVQAFAQAAGLPVMPGPRPLGGHILSHDFVEAALIRRAGWRVRMAPEQAGSWEQSPPTLLDSAARDRRWAQGNIQHMGVISTRGIRWPNRVHMLIGVMSYLASPVWLMMMTVGLIISAQIERQEFQYFTDTFQLFPNWPVFDAQRMVDLFVFTMAVLLLPKAIGFITGLFRRDIRCAMGPVRLTLSVLTELLFSILFAPIFMLIHSRQIWEIIRGQDSGWSTQQRDMRGTDWRLLFARHWCHSTLGLALGAALLWLQNPLLYWMLPIVVGLILSIPLSALSGSQAVAAWLAAPGLLRTMEESILPAEVRDRDKLNAAFSDAALPMNVHAMLTNPSLAARHFALAGERPACPRGEPDMAAEGARLKLHDALSTSEALAWLNARELMAVLNDRQLFNTLVRTHQPRQESSPSVMT